MYVDTYDKRMIIQRKTYTSKEKKGLHKLQL